MRSPVPRVAVPLLAALVLFAGPGASAEDCANCSTLNRAEGRASAAPRLSNDVSAALLSNAPGRCREGRPTGELSKVLVNWLDNLTVGSVNTAIGAGTLIVTLIANPITRSGAPKIGLLTGAGTQQIVVENAAVSPMGAFSLGAFAFGMGMSEDDYRHEAGHSYASGTVGPLYLPLVLSEYLWNVGVLRRDFYEAHDSFVMEAWADAEADALRKFCSEFVTEIGAGQVKTASGSAPFISIRLSLNEKGEGGSEARDLRVRKLYEWLRTDVVAPVAALAARNGKASPIRYDFNLLEKTVRVSGAMSYEKSPSPRTRGLSFVIDTDQHYGRARNVPVANRIELTALGADAKFGLEYAAGPKLSGAASAGIGAALAGVRPRDYGGELRAPHAAFGIERSVSLAQEADVARTFRLHNSSEKAWLADGAERATVIRGLDNRDRQVARDNPRVLDRVNLSVEYERSRYRLEGASATQSQWRLGTGLKF